MRQNDTFKRRRAMLPGGAAMRGATVLPVRAIAGGSDGRYLLEMRKRTAGSVWYRSEPCSDRSCPHGVPYPGDGVCVIRDYAVSPIGWRSRWIENTMGRSAMACLGIHAREARTPAVDTTVAVVSCRSR